MENFTHFPTLIADFLEGRRNGDDGLIPPENTLSQTIGRAVLEDGEKVIDKAWHEEEERRGLYKKVSKIFHKEGCYSGS